MVDSKVATQKTTVIEPECLYAICFLIKFPHNARSDWLRQRALSEIRERVDGIKLASKYLLRNLDKFDPNFKHPCATQTKSIQTSYLSAVNMVHREHS